MRSKRKIICVIDNFEKRVSLILILLILSGCVEEFQPESIKFESILVVEATLTNEFQKHEVLLSRTTPIENNQIQPETNATVSIIDDKLNEFLFEEIEPGRYRSIDPFMAIENEAYQLTILTEDGTSYISKKESMVGSGSIDELSASRRINENGIDGVEITISANSNLNGVAYFRYKYEETYQIISTFNPTDDLFIISENPPLVELRRREKQDRVCYNTVESNTIIVANTSGLTENKIINFPIRFIANNDFMLRNRYSINVKQLAQTREAYTFYDNLLEFSNSESLFTQTQAGFIEGNIKSVDNSNEKILGFFNVSSVSSIRIFFNYREIFPDLNFPRAQFNCGGDSFLGGFGSSDQDLVNFLNSGSFRYVTTEFGSYYLAPAICVDCTLQGSNIEPDFWEE